METITQIIIPRVSISDVWKRANNPSVILWMPKYRKKLSLEGIEFDKRLADAQNTTNIVETKADKFDVKCEQCQESNCRHFLDESIGCFWCRRHCDGEHVGIPIRTEYCDDLTIYYMYGRYCSFNCALADLREKIGKNVNGQPQFIQCESLLKQLFHIQQPDSTLVPAPHWTLLDINGGELTDDQFNQDRFCYHHTNKYFRLGVSMEFLRKINGK